VGCEGATWPADTVAHAKIDLRYGLSSQNYFPKGGRLLSLSPAFIACPSYARNSIHPGC
jgi:hypothetical protein